MTHDENDTKHAELIEPEKKFSGIVKKGKKQFFYYPEEPISCGGDEVEYFHFKKPNLKKCKAHNVVLGNDMPAKSMEALLRASLLRIAKKDGGEFLAHDYREILEDVEMDEIVAMTNECSNFFVKVAG